MPLLRGGTSLGREAIYWHFPGYLGAGSNTWRTTPGGAIRAGNWKLIEYFEDGRLELYNLAEDLGERNNLATKMPERARELHDKLVAWREQVGARMPTSNSARQDEAQEARVKKRKKRAKAE